MTLSISKNEANSAESAIAPCLICAKTTNLFCSRCGKAFYCSSTCQEADWPCHEFNCTPASVEVDRSPLLAPLSGLIQTHARFRNNVTSRANLTGRISRINQLQQLAVFSPLSLIGAGGSRECPLLVLKSFAFSPSSDPTLNLPSFVLALEAEQGRQLYNPATCCIEEISKSEAVELVNLFIKHITPDFIKAKMNGSLEMLSRQFMLKYCDLQQTPFIFCIKINSHQDLISILKALVDGYYIDPTVPSRFGQKSMADPAESFLYVCPRTPNRTELYNFTLGQLHEQGCVMDDLLYTIDFSYLESDTGRSRMTSIVYCNRKNGDYCSKNLHREG